jgi:hypothetical protein
MVTYMFAVEPNIDRRIYAKPTELPRYGFHPLRFRAQEPPPSLHTDF